MSRVFFYIMTARTLTIHYNQKSLGAFANKIQRHTEYDAGLGNELIKLLKTSNAICIDTNGAKPSNKTKESESVDDLEAFLLERWPMCIVTDCTLSKKSHAGDVWVTFPHIDPQVAIMIELKHWSSPISTSEVTKFWNDWSLHAGQFDGALFVSWSDAPIARCKSLEVVRWGIHKKPIIFLVGGSTRPLLLEQCIQLIIGSKTCQCDTSRLVASKEALEGHVADLEGDIRELRQKMLKKTRRLEQIKRQLESLEEK